jgi:hypothetical protein
MRSFYTFSLIFIFSLATAYSAQGFYEHHTLAQVKMPSLTLNSKTSPIRTWGFPHFLFKN